MPQNEQNRPQWIKPKVIVGFLLIAIFSATAIVMTYRGVNDLKLTREGFGLPGQKITVLNRLITSIYNEDSEFRMFVLTTNENYLSAYKNGHKNVTAALKSLQKLAYDNPQQINSINKIQGLLEKKRQTENELLEMMVNINSNTFYDKAIQKIARAGAETQRYAQIYRQKIITHYKRDTVVERKSTSNSMASRVKRFFLGPEKIDTVTTDTLVEISYDTIPNIKYISDSIINKLLLILDDIKTDQQRNLNLLGEKERELLNRNRAILTQIQLIVSSIERQEQGEVLTQSITIQEVLSKTLIKILLLGTFTFIALIVLLAIIFRDISRNTAYNAQLLEAKQYAESLLRLKEQFLANMSHEIRSPLSAIVGISRQLEKTDLSTKQKEYVAILNNSSNHLLSVINDILDYSKLETGKLRLENRRFSPRDTIDEVVKLFEGKAEEKKLQLLSNIDLTVPEMLWGDDFRLKQVLINLLSNAIKFTHEGNIILSATVIRQNSESVKLQFTVADTGIGIPPEMQSQIFEEFTQADAGTARRYGGTGLGLTIVKKLVELQGGEVSLYSQPSEGTIVKIVIPYVIQQQYLAENESQISYQWDEENTILIIDDDEVNRLIIAEMVKSIGLKTETLGEASNLLEILKEKKYNAIITDIQMPEISGYDVVQMVEQAGLDIPVFAVTANNMVDNPEHFSSLGFSGYLIKPFVEEDLVRLLGPILGNIKRPNYTKSKRITGQSSKFDIAELYRFTGGDEKAVRLILQSLLENTQRNMEDLSRSVKAKDMKKVSALAHKMKSAFNQFRIYEIAGILQKIENLPENKHKAAQLYVERLSRLVKNFTAEVNMLLERITS